MLLSPGYGYPHAQFNKRLGISKASLDHSLIMTLFVKPSLERLMTAILQVKKINIFYREIQNPYYLNWYLKLTKWFL